MTEEIPASNGEIIEISTCHNGMNFMMKSPVFETAWHFVGSNDWHEAGKCFTPESAVKQHNEVAENIANIVTRESRSFRQRVEQSAGIVNIEPPPFEGDEDRAPTEHEGISWHEAERQHWEDNNPFRR